MIIENAHIFVIAACLLVVIVLMIGLGGFAFGGDFNKKYANKIMRLRILLQAIAILFIIFFVYGPVFPVPCLRGRGLRFGVRVFNVFVLFDFQETTLKTQAEPTR